MARLASDGRDAARGRASDLEFVTSLFIVGDDVPPNVERYIGYHVATLAAHDSLTLPRGSVSEMVDELQRRRESLGASYVTVHVD
jgi:hypothetical protein